MGFNFFSNQQNAALSPPMKQKTLLKASKIVIKREIMSSAKLESSWNDTNKEAVGLSARGDTNFVHWVVKVLHNLKQNQSFHKTKSEGKNETNNKKIALVIEGGEMRGCITGGMVCGINYLGLRDCVDVVYGSSASIIIWAYFITGQLPWFSPEVYYNQLTMAGKSFINTNRLLLALGLGLLNPKLLRDVLFRQNAGKPLLNLDFLLQTTMQEQKPLNWESFVKQQEPQPLKIIGSCLKREGLLVMSYDDKNFESPKELSKCIYASALLPGIADPMVNMLVDKDNANKKPKFVLKNNFKDKSYKRLADALVYNPIPYKVAMEDGATHMIVLRSKPNDRDVIGKGRNLGEKLVWSLFFLRKNKLPQIYQRLMKQLHKKLYTKNVLELNKALTIDNSASKLRPTLTVVIPGTIKEVPCLEVGRKAIFEGVWDGFARA